MVAIIRAVRTPIGSFKGSLSSLSATELGSIAITAALSNTKIKTVDEVIMGQVLTAGAGQAPARQAALGARLANSTECLTINKVCGSGLKAVMLACDKITLDPDKIIVCGGQESMSTAPFLLKNLRDGYRMGHQNIIDSMIHDGLWDPYNNQHMGNFGELCAREKNYSRKAQDEFAIESYKKSINAIKNGLFDNEIVPVEYKNKKEVIKITEDEEPKKVMFEKIPKLKPVFEQEGTITAANASKLNDGAAVLILMSEERAKKLSLKPIAKIVAHGSFAADPSWFTTAPIGAVKKVLDLAKMKPDQIDLWEINEAFAAQAMVCIDHYKINKANVNVNGGAIALGHPIGASGARILTTLLHALNNLKLNLGLATLCIGGGEASAMIVRT